jgi:hypothetical protein
MRNSNRLVAIVLLAFAVTPLSQAADVMSLNPPEGDWAPHWDWFQTYVVPNISGVTFQCGWSQIETQQGVYDFSSCDNKITNWEGTGMKIGIIISPISFRSNTFTPAYVYSSSYAQSLGAKQLDYCVCDGNVAGYPGSGKTPMNTCAHSGDTTAYPAVWEAPFQKAYRKFIAAAMEHFNSVSWKAQIAYIRFGRSSGGETNDRCETQLLTLVNGSMSELEQDWVGNAVGNDDLEAQQAHSFPLQNSVACSADGDCSWADEEAANAVSLGIGIGSEGVTNHDIKMYNQGKPTDSNWASLFDEYTGQVQVLQTQSLMQSNPSGKGVVGSLVPLMPFETVHHANTIEFYIEDLYCAYVPGYHDSTGCPSGYAPYKPYQEAIANAEAQ